MWIYCCGWNDTTTNLPLSTTPSAAKLWLFALPPWLLFEMLILLTINWTHNRKKYHTNNLCTNIWMHFLYFYHLVAYQRASLFPILKSIWRLVFSYSYPTMQLVFAQTLSRHKYTVNKTNFSAYSDQFKQLFCTSVSIQTNEDAIFYLIITKRKKKVDTVFVYKEIDRRWHLFSKGKCKQRKYTLKILSLNNQY